MPEVLEAVARAIGDSGTYTVNSWRAHLPAARAALNALADECTCGIIDTMWLREMAAEPVTVEDVLNKHSPIGDVDGFPTVECDFVGCGVFQHGKAFAQHQADMLRAAGLVKEDA